MKRASWVEQPSDAFARRQLARAVLLLDLLRAAAFAELFFQLPQSSDQVPHVRHAGLLPGCVVRRLHPTISVTAPVPASEDFIQPLFELRQFSP